MIRRIPFLVLALLISIGAFTACALISPEASFSPVHPQELGAGRPMCSTCHTTDTFKGAAKPFASFDHTPTFVKEHRFQAAQDSATCATCHSQAFCSDCHGGKTVMQPSAKLGQRPDRMSPHRGGYMILHRMEGKVDPSGCYKCHGRANNDKCRACHK